MFAIMTFTLFYFNYILIISFIGVLCASTYKHPHICTYIVFTGLSHACTYHRTIQRAGRSLKKAASKPAIYYKQ